MQIGRGRVEAAVDAQRFAGLAALLEARRCSSRSIFVQVRSSPKSTPRMRMRICSSTGGNSAMSLCSIILVLAYKNAWTTAPHVLETSTTKGRPEGRSHRQGAQQRLDGVPCTPKIQVSRLVCAGLSRPQFYHGRIIPELNIRVKPSSNQGTHLEIVTLRGCATSDAPAAYPTIGVWTRTDCIMSALVEPREVVVHDWGSRGTESEVSNAATRQIWSEIRERSSMAKSQDWTKNEYLGSPLLTPARIRLHLHPVKRSGQRPISLTTSTTLKPQQPTGPLAQCQSQMMASSLLFEGTIRRPRLPPLNVRCQTPWQTTGRTVSRRCFRCYAMGC